MDDDEREIRDLVRAWVESSKVGDLPALMELMTDDVIFLTPGEAPFGKEAFAEKVAPVAGVEIESRVEIQEIDISGNRAYLRNYIELTVTQAGQTSKRMSGPTLGVLRKEADGRWRLARDANLVMPE